MFKIIFVGIEMYYSCENFGPFIHAVLLCAAESGWMLGLNGRGSTLSLICSFFSLLNEELSLTKICTDWGDWKDHQQAFSSVFTTIIIIIK